MSNINNSLVVSEQKAEISREELIARINKVRDWGFIPHLCQYRPKSDGGKYPVWGEFTEEFKFTNKFTSTWKGKDGQPRGWFGLKKFLPTEVIADFILSTKNESDLFRRWLLGTIILDQSCVIDTDETASTENWIEIFNSRGIPYVFERSFSCTKENYKGHFLFHIDKPVFSPNSIKFSGLRVYEGKQGSGEVLGKNHIVVLNIIDGWDKSPCDYNEISKLPIDLVETTTPIVLNTSDNNDKEDFVLDDYSCINIPAILGKLRYRVSKQQARKILKTIRDVCAIKEHSCSDEQLTQIMKNYSPKYFQLKDVELGSGERHGDFIKMCSTLNNCGFNRQQMKDILKTYCQVTMLGKNAWDEVRFNKDFDGYTYELSNPDGVYFTKDTDDLVDEICKRTNPGVMDYIGMLSENKYTFINGMYQYVIDKGIWTMVEENIFRTRVERLIREHNLNDVPRYLNSIVNIAPASLGHEDKVMMNNSKNLLNVKNGMFDTSSYTLTDHAEEYYSTYQIPIDYDPVADCPLWKNKIAEILNNDQQKIDVIQEWFGYCLTTETKYHKALLLYGNGRNGKNVIGDTLAKLVGEEATARLKYEQLSESYHAYELKDKTLNWGEEVKGNEIADTSIFKAITSGGALTTRMIYGKPEKIFFNVKLMFSGNEFPANRDRSDGFIDRWIIIPLIIKFEMDDPKTDKDLTKKLEAELPGIFNWAVEGLKRLRAQDNFSLCQADIAAKLEYQKDYNSPFAFCEENYVLDSSMSIKDGVKTTSFYEEYRTWCQNNGYQALAKRRFMQTIRERYKTQEEKSEGCYYFKFKLTAQISNAPF